MREFSSWDHWARLLVSCGNGLFGLFVPFRLLLVLGGGAGGGCNNTQGSFHPTSHSPGWFFSAGRPRRSRSRSCWRPPETCLPSPAAWPGHPLLTARSLLPPPSASFPQLYFVKCLKLRKHVRAMQDSVVLTGLAELAERKLLSGSQLLLDV